MEKRPDETRSVWEGVEECQSRYKNMKVEKYGLPYITTLTYLNRFKSKFVRCISRTMIHEWIIISLNPILDTWVGATEETLKAKSCDSDSDFACSLIPLLLNQWEQAKVKTELGSELVIQWVQLHVPLNVHQ